MPINKRIIVAVIIIMATGLYQVLVIKGSQGGIGGVANPNPRRATVTRVVVGAYILGIVVSLVDLLGGPFAHVGAMMLLVATATALYAIIPDIAQRMGKRNEGAGGAPGGGGQATRK